MPFMRISILFAFFAFSYAIAEDCEEGNFKIFAETSTGKEDLGCDDEVSIEITYGETLTLSVEPETDIYSWRVSSTEIQEGSSFSPKFSVSDNPPEDGVTETYIVRNKAGITKTIVITIQIPIYIVRFDTDGADNVTDDDEELYQEVMKGSQAKEPELELEKEGYDFDGWDFDFSTPITQDTTIKAKWKWKIKIYLVDFDTDGGTPSIRSQMVMEYDLAKEPKETLTRIGYNFEGWDFDFSTPIVEDTTIKAIWKISDSFYGDTIVFDDPGFDIDSIFSSKQRHYYIASPSLCEVKDTIKIQITTKESDVILRINSIPQRSTDEKGLHYEIPFIFKNKPGLDTLIYEWISKDGSNSKYDTILIETPIPFDTIVGKKWNNVLFVNNNPKTNGGYKFTDFEWFKNNEKLGNLQFYSATNNNANDIYKVVMQTTEGIRISTCEGKIKISSGQPRRTIKRTTKQVLGINEKSLNPDSKIYNLNGKLTKETPAGVYIVKEK